MTNAKTPIPGGQTPRHLRVDVGGVAIYVRSELECQYLAAFNRKMAVAKMALHRIAEAFDDDGPFIAAKAIEDMKNV